ncbi:hypothetical protein AFE02nite_13460 [Actinotalea fermentans]|uniref:AbiEi antitoxin C-terminal domain-containing protein n=1 Tax=Actinotalea fermentans TaxID=43671 RepID=A0A511YWQ2_9CELL|nr:hypothetical protein AFE02nite_13460 [Actinotalea fermentans]
MPWTVRTSCCDELGISGRVLRGPAFTRVRRGVYVPAGADPYSPDNRIAAVVAGLPVHAALGGWAAARILEREAASDGLEVFDGGRWWAEAPTQHSTLGVVVPRLGVAGSGGSAPILVCAARESRLAGRPDARIFRSPVADDDVLSLGDARMTAPVRTAFDLARLLPIGRAVVALDRLVHLGVVAPTDLAEYAKGRRGWRGASRVHRVLRLVDGRSESPQESVLRLVWVASGMPRPRANLVVRTASREFVARVDLVDEVAGVAGEYDGAWHSGGDRRSRDSRRHERLLALGVEVVRATSADLGSDARAAEWQGRLRAAYRRARRRPHARAWTVTPS